MKNLKSVFVQLVKKILDKWGDSLLFVALTPLALSDTLPATVVDIISDISKDLFEDFFRRQLTGPEAEDIRARAMGAATRLEEASDIISELQTELRARSEHLDHIMGEVVRREEEAMHWVNLASVNEELASAFTTEVERRVREQIRAELDKGKRRRQILSMVMWLITLAMGAIAGAVVQQWWSTGRLLP